MQELKGSFVALVTPMKSNGEIDFPALKELVEWHIESGTHGLVSVGTTGESATLNFNDHVKVLEKTISYINNKIVAIAGTGANSTDEAIELNKAASSIGYEFALSVTPYYNKPNQLGLEAHYKKIADSGVEFYTCDDDDLDKEYGMYYGNLEFDPLDIMQQTNGHTKMFHKENGKWRQL